jgi:hypothetical protein
MPLFDDEARTDPSPAHDGEGSFTFMNRVDQPYWHRIRQVIDRWFEDYPRAEAADLRSRFRSADPSQHFGAWWELYLHRLFRCLGYEVEVHPTLEGISGHPDFRLRKGPSELLVEAVTTFSGIVDDERHGERETWITAAINQASHSNFFVALDFTRVGHERPAVREIVDPLITWLDGLDADEVATVDFSEAPQLRLQPRDWDFTLTAIPIKPEARGKPGHRLLGMGPSMGGAVNDVEMLGRTLERKRRKYGKPGLPLVFAVLLMSSFMENEDIEQALLGRIAYQFQVDSPEEGRWIRQRNGFWMQGARARGTRVSALLTGTNLMPWNCNTIWPRLWPNPWAAEPLDVECDFPKGIANDRGLVEYEEVGDEPGTLMGLPSGWPGPEAPFEKRAGNS